MLLPRASHKAPIHFVSGIRTVLMPASSGASATERVADILAYVGISPKAPNSRVNQNIPQCTTFVTPIFFPSSVSGGFAKH